jgi:RNA polymerase sigma-70 factor (ECF subfamily)
MNNPAPLLARAEPADIDHLLQHGKASQATLMELMLSQHYASIYRLCLALISEGGSADAAADADDAAQETFIDALACIERYEPGTNLRAWLAKIAIHKCQGLLRKRRTRQTLQSALTGVYSLFSRAENVAQQAARRETRGQLWQAVEGLHEKQRIPVILFYVYDYSIAEIAEALDLPTGTVCSRLHYGIEKLRKQLGTALDFQDEEGVG